VSKRPLVLAPTRGTTALTFGRATSIVYSTPAHHVTRIPASPSAACTTLAARGCTAHSRRGPSLRRVDRNTPGHTSCRVGLAGGLAAAIASGCSSADRNTTA
jgi:hypothetical protein